MTRNVIHRGSTACFNTIIVTLNLFPLIYFQPQNILLTDESPLGDIRIVDFGLSRVMMNSEELREIMGTPEYVGKLLAPC